MTFYANSSRINETHVSLRFAMIMWVAITNTRSEMFKITSEDKMILTGLGIVLVVILLAIGTCSLISLLSPNTNKTESTKICKCF